MIGCILSKVQIWIVEKEEYDIKNISKIFLDKLIKKSNWMNLIWKLKRVKCLYEGVLRWI